MWSRRPLDKQMQTGWSTAAIAGVNMSKWLTANLQLAPLPIADGIPELIGEQLEVDIPGVFGRNVVHHYIIDNGSQGNTVTQAMVDKLLSQTEPYGAQGNTWGNVVDLSESVVLTIIAYNTVRATVQQCDHTNGTAVQRTTYDKYNAWRTTYDGYNVRCTTVWHGHRRWVSMQ